MRTTFNAARYIFLLCKSLDYLDSIPERSRRSLEALGLWRFDPEYGFEPSDELRLLCRLAEEACPRVRRYKPLERVPVLISLAMIELLLYLAARSPIHVDDMEADGLDLRRYASAVYRLRLKEWARFEGEPPNPRVVLTENGYRAVRRLLELYC